MAEIRLVDNSLLNKARRIFRRSGIRLTVRNGHIYTVRARQIVQPKTEKQLRNWAIFTEANRLTDLDLRENGRQRYWRRRAAEQGYKTARGCAKAFYVKQVKSGRVTESDRSLLVSSMQHGWITRRRTRKPRPLWTDLNIDVTPTALQDNRVVWV